MNLLLPHLALKLDGRIGGLVQDLLARVVEAVREALEQDQCQKHHLQGTNKGGVRWVGGSKSGYPFGQSTIFCRIGSVVVDRTGAIDK